MNIFVANLSFRTTHDDLRQLFESHGEVASARIITDKETRRSRGFGFVEMPNDNEAAQAIEQLNGADFGGRPISVSESKPKGE